MASGVETGLKTGTSNKEVLTVSLKAAGQTYYRSRQGKEWEVYTKRSMGDSAKSLGGEEVFCMRSMLIRPGLSSGKA